MSVEQKKDARMATGWERVVDRDRVGVGVGVRVREGMCDVSRGTSKGCEVKGEVVERSEVMVKGRKEGRKEV
jgi:hypothetical protein